MKVTLDLPKEDIEFLDDYASRHGRPGRSDAARKAVELLRFSELGPAYEHAWDDWHKSGEATVWEGADADGPAGSDGEVG